MDLDIQQMEEVTLNLPFYINKIPRFDITCAHAITIKIYLCMYIKHIGITSSNGIVMRRLKG